MMLSRKSKGMLQTSVILVLLSCLGYAFYVYSNLQNKYDMLDQKLFREQSQHQALSLQMQACYEEKANLDTSLTKLRGDCQKQKEVSEETIQGLLIEHQDKITALEKSNEKLEKQNKQLSVDYRLSKANHEKLNKDHDALKKKYQTEVENHSADMYHANEELVNCQSRFEAFRKEEANIQQQLQSVRSDHEKLVVTLRSIPRNLLNLDHSLAQHLADNTKAYIIGHFGGLVQQDYKAPAGDLLPQQQPVALTGNNQNNLNSNQQQNIQNENAVAINRRSVNQDAGQQPQYGGDANAVSLNQGDAVPMDAGGNEEKTVETVKPVKQEHDGLNPEPLAEKNENRPAEEMDNGHKDESMVDESNRMQQDIHADMQQVDGNQIDALDNYAAKNNYNDAVHDDPLNQPQDPQVGDDDEDDPAIESQNDLSKESQEEDGDKVAHDLGLQDNDEDQLDYDRNDNIHEEDEEGDNDANGNQQENDNSMNEAVGNDKGQVVMPPAARVSDDELELAVNAPPEQKQSILDINDKQKSIGKQNEEGNDDDDHVDVYENQDYDNDRRGDANDGPEKVADYYQNEVESEEERKQRELRDMKRDRYDKNFVAINQVQNVVPNGMNLPKRPETWE